MYKKGSSWRVWGLLTVILVVIIFAINNPSYNDVTGDVVRDDHYEDEVERQQEEDNNQQQMEDELQRQQEEDNNQQQMEEELQRQYEQEQYEDQLNKQESQKSPACPSGWKCRDSNTKAYQSTDCSWSESKNCEYGCSRGKCNYKPQTTEITVSSVSDGDTIKLSSGETVRLIGINTPESGYFCSTEATDKLKDFVLGEEVTLEQDVDDKDQYGRLLRYVHVDDTFVNLEMVRLGLAHKYEYGSNTKYSLQFEQAENEAKQNEGCLWKSSQEDYVQDHCIHITDFHSNADGDDNYNLNDEYVTFGNKCSYSIDMNDWTVKDETASHIYTFPSFIFHGKAAFTLYTGTGADTDSALYWGRTSGNYASIWNNGGDTLFLRDSNGYLVLTQDC